MIMALLQQASAPGWQDHLTDLVTSIDCRVRNMSEAGGCRAPKFSAWHIFLFYRVPNQEKPVYRWPRWSRSGPARAPRPKAAGLIKLARNPFFGSKRNNASILKLAPRLLRPQEAARDLRCRGVGVGVRESGRRPRSTKFARHSLRPGS